MLKQPGGIRIPLFALRRQQRLALQLPLKQDQNSHQIWANSATFSSRETWGNPGPKRGLHMFTPAIRRIAKQKETLVPTHQEDATRRGFVNVSFGHLTIAATVEQPLGLLVAQICQPPRGYSLYAFKLFCLLSKTVWLKLRIPKRSCESLTHIQFFLL